MLVSRSTAPCRTRVDYHCQFKIQLTVRGVGFYCVCRDETANDCGGPLRGNRTAQIRDISE